MLAVLACASAAQAQPAPSAQPNENDSPEGQANAPADGTGMRLRAHGRVVPFLENGILIGGKVSGKALEPLVEDESGHHRIRFVLEAGAEWRLATGRWRLGGSFRGSVDGNTNTDVAVLARGSWTPRGQWTARMALGPIVYYDAPAAGGCGRCRFQNGSLQDLGFVARVGLGHQSGFAADVELSTIIYDVGRDVRPLGTEVTLYAGVTTSRVRVALALLLAEVMIRAVVLDRNRPDT